MIRAAWIVTALASLGFAVYTFVQIAKGLIGPHQPLNDFFALWCFAKFSLTQDVQQIYNAPFLHGYMISVDGALRQKFPYAYPPSFLLMIEPLGMLSHRAAYLAWTLATLALHFTASTLGRRRGWLDAAVVLAPAAIANMYFGQTGFLSSAFLVGGFRLLPSRPILAGILFGLLTFKPQLGLLIPVALLATRQWRAIVSTVAMTILLAIASGLVFGWAVWREFFATIITHSSYVEFQVNNHYKPTVMANLEIIGFTHTIAHAAQLAATAIVVAIIWLCFRKRNDAISIAALQVGTFLASPYAFVYDLPMLTNATLAVFRRDRAEGRLNIVEAGILSLSVLFPIAMILTWRLYWLSVTGLVLLFGLIVWRIFYSAAARPLPSQSAMSASARME